VTQIVNAKSVAAHLIAGDGSTDDTASIQVILNDAAGKEVVYFSMASIS
jgi:glucan 1,3-beta-glucosidase